jgi:hypothetical protein
VPAENEGPDKTIEDDTDKDGPPLRWRGTSFTWNHAATTTLVGVGRDNIGGELEQYSWTFTFRPKYFIVDLPKDKVTVSVDIGAEVELTDSALTTDRNELLFQDLLAGVAYSRNLWESGGKDKGEYKTSASVSGRVRFATSKFSYGQGKYATTLLGTSLNQQLKLLGNKADALNNLTVGFSLTWGHLFAESYAPVNENAARPRQNASGQAEVSDVLGGYSFGMNTLTGALSADLPIYKGLQLSTRGPELQHARRGRYGPRLPEHHAVDRRERPAAQRLLQPGRAVLRRYHGEPRFDLHEGHAALEEAVVAARAADRVALIRAISSHATPSARRSPAWLSFSGSS